MLPPQETLLLRLLRSNTSFIIYGQKASGKTKLVHDLLQKSKSDYIEINCTLTSKKQNFLWLFNVELKKYLKSKGVVVEGLGQVVNLDSWISELKRLAIEKRQIVELLDNLYIFMDNIEQMAFQQSFMPSFYNACQKEFSFRFSFIFCGINFLRKQYTLDLPFRTMISFCMPRSVEQFTTIVEEAVWEVFKAKELKQPEAQIQKAVKQLVKQIRASFLDIESNLEKVKNIARVITSTTFDMMPDTKDISKSISGMINKGELKKIIMQVIQHGPMHDTNMKNKLQAIDGDEIHDVPQNLEYYPQLILASIHMADYYPEKEDKRRFQDYKGRSNARNKDLKKCDFKIGKHNINRIIAISQALESQAKQNDKEYSVQHHTLDYYTTFQNLRNENRIKFFGNKITGTVKEEQAKAFIAKCELKYDQFMSG